MKMRIVLIVGFLVIAMKLWSFGGYDISKEERKRLSEDTTLRSYPLAEWVGITEDIQKFTFTMKIWKTSSRYRFDIEFPDMSGRSKDKVLGAEIDGKTVKEAFAEVFSLVVEDVKTGRIIYWHNEKPFRSGASSLVYYKWFIASKLRFKRNREYQVYLTLPGIKDVPKEIERFQLNCYINPRPML